MENKEGSLVTDESVEKCDCSISTFIDEETLTFGRGELYSFGDWEYPCEKCTNAYTLSLKEKK